MNIVNMHEAKTNLSRLVARVSEGESFVIARNGKPLAKVVPYEEPIPATVKRTGFLKGQFGVPDDFDTMFQDEIVAMFEGTDE